MGSRMGLIGCLIVVVALLNGATAQVTSAGVYEVGDSLGWTVPPNTSYYTNWASTKTFFVGDRLTQLVTIFSSTGPDYIISTESNHCELGQKFSFNVSAVGSPTTRPTPPLHL
uniref:Phytocyanin domain-containing protein n=1 Tax=Fagus sylvatica TaxID=28930 RepID=A0A2N9GY90_FAGSY